MIAVSNYSRLRHLRRRRRHRRGRRRSAATTTRRTRGEISGARAAVPGGHREVFSTLTTRGDKGGTEPWSRIGTGGSSNVRGEHR